MDNKNQEKTKEINFDLDNTNTLDVSFVEHKNKKVYIIVSIIILILIIGIGVGIYFYLENKKEEEKKQEENNKQQEIVETDKKEQLNIYGKKLEEIVLNNIKQNNNLLKFEEANKLIENNYDINCQVHEIYKDGKVYLNRCFIDGKKVEYIYGVKQEEEEEFDSTRMTKVYINKENNKDKILEEPEEIDKYNEVVFKCNERCSDFTILGESDYIIYLDKNNIVKVKDIYTSKKILEDVKYKEAYPIYNSKDNTYDSEYIILYNGYKWGIYNYVTSKPLIGFLYDNLNVSLENKTGPKTKYIETIKDKLLPAVKVKKMGVIDYSTGKEIIPIEYDSLVKSENLILATDIDNNKNILYDESGNKYLKDNYDNIYGIINGNYLLTEKNKNILLIKIDGEELYNYGEIKDIGKINFQLEYDDKYIYNLYKKDSNKCLEFVYDNKYKKGTFKEVDC